MWTGLSSLKSLQLRSDAITTIQAGPFSELGQLEILNLAYNSLHMVHSSMWKGLNYLKVLNLEGTLLNTILPRGFFNLPKLEILDLSYTKLNSFPLDVFDPQYFENGHPKNLTLNLRKVPLECDDCLCWMKKGEEEGWLHWWKRFTIDGKAKHLGGLDAESSAEENEGACYATLYSCHWDDCEQQIIANVFEMILFLTKVLSWTLLWVNLRRIYLLYEKMFHWLDLWSQVNFGTRLGNRQTQLFRHLAKPGWVQKQGQVSTVSTTGDLCFSCCSAYLLQKNYIEHQAKERRWIVRGKICFERSSLCFHGQQHVVCRLDVEQWKTHMYKLTHLHKMTTVLVRFNKPLQGSRECVQGLKNRISNSDIVRSGFDTIPYKNVTVDMLWFETGKQWFCVLEQRHDCMFSWVWAAVFILWWEVASKASTTHRQCSKEWNSNRMRQAPHLWEQVSDFLCKRLFVCVSSEKETLAWKAPQQKIYRIYNYWTL